MFPKDIHSNTKKRFFQSKASTAVIVVCIALTLGLGFFLRPIFSEHTAEAVDSSRPQPPLVESQANEDTTESIITTDNFTENDVLNNSPITGISSETQIQVVRDTPLTADNFRIEREQLLIDTCFDKPDHGDWIIWEASLLLDGKEIEYAGSFPMAFQLDNMSQKEQRCDTIYFEGLASDTDFSNATFIVEWLLAYPREGEACSPESLAKYQKALDAQNAGITVECFIEELAGGGMSGVQVASKPEAMSQEEAEAILHKHDFFMNLHGIQGPWMFPFSLER